MKKRGFLLAALGATALLTTSCLKDKYSFENVELDYSPTFALPLIEAEMKTEDLLDDLDTSLIKVGNDDVLKIVFTDTIKTIDINEFVAITDQSSNGSIDIPAVTIDDMTETSSYTMAQLGPSMDPVTWAILQAASAAPNIIPPFGPEDGGAHSSGTLSGFTTLKFSKGTLAMSITNNWKIPVTMKVKLTSVSNGLILDTLEFNNVQPGQKATDQTDMMNKTLGNEIEFNIYSLSSAGSSGAPVQLNTADELDIEMAFTNAEIVGGVAEIPSQDLTTESVSIDMGMSNGEELDSIELASASMTYSINYGVREDANLTISLPYAKKNGVAFSQVISIDSDNSTATVVNGSFDLAGYVLDLTEGGTTVNSFKADVTAAVVSSGISVPFDTSDAVTYDFGITGLKVARVHGYFGTQNINFADAEAETGFADDELLSAITLTNPSVILSCDNGFGIPMAFTALNVKMTGGTSDVTLTGLSLPIDIAAGGPSSVVQTDIVVDANTTNIDEGLNTQPTKFVVGGDASINPAGKTANYADTNSRLTVRMNVEVPMQGRIEGLLISDTLDLDLGDLFENVGYAKLKSNITNEFPLDGKVQFYFVDENYNVLDSLVDEAGGKSFMKASVTNAQGVTTAASDEASFFELDEDKISRIQATKKVIVNARVSSGNGGTKEMKILSTYDLNIKLGLAAKIKVGQLLGGDGE